MFPNCLTASEKQKASQMDTDLGGENQDFLTPRSTGLTAFQGEPSVLSSHPQIRGMTSLACQLIRLPIGSWWVGPPGVCRHPLHHSQARRLALCPRAGLGGKCPRSGPSGSWRRGQDVWAELPAHDQKETSGCGFSATPSTPQHPHRKKVKSLSHV